MNVALPSRTQSEGQAAARQLNEIRPDSAIGLVSAVHNPVSERSVVQATPDKWGLIDAGIAHVDVGHFPSMEDRSPEHWQQTIDINLIGVFNTVKASLATGGVPIGRIKKGVDA